jgi:hypothetical protein
LCAISLCFQNVCFENISETQFEDRKILTSELFPDNFNYDVYRNDRTLNGGGVILLVNKTYNSMPLYNLENGSESVWAKIMFDGSPHFFGCWYKDPESPSDHIQLLDDQLIKIGGLNNTKKSPNIHLMGDFNFPAIDWNENTGPNSKHICQS